MPPPTQAQTGYGVQLWRGDGATPEVFTKISEVFDAAPGDKTTSKVDATHMESPNRHMESIPGMKDTAELAVKVNWIISDPTHQSLLTDQKNRRVGNWRLVLPGGAFRAEGPAFVAKLGELLPINGRMERTVSLQPTGEWNLVANV